MNFYIKIFFLGLVFSILYSAALFADIYTELDRKLNMFSFKTYLQREKNIQRVYFINDKTEFNVNIESELLMGFKIHGVIFFMEKIKNNQDKLSKYLNPKSEILLYDFVMEIEKEDMEQIEKDELENIYRAGNITSQLIKTFTKEIAGTYIFKYDDKSKKIQIINGSKTAGEYSLSSGQFFFKDIYWLKQYCAFEILKFHTFIIKEMYFPPRFFPVNNFGVQRDFNMIIMDADAYFFKHNMNFTRKIEKYSDKHYFTLEYYFNNKFVIGYNSLLDILYDKPSNKYIDNEENDFLNRESILISDYLNYYYWQNNKTYPSFQPDLIHYLNNIKDLKIYDNDYDKNNFFLYGNLLNFYFTINISDTNIEYKNDFVNQKYYAFIKFNEKKSMIKPHNTYRWKNVKKYYK